MATEEKHCLKAVLNVDLAKLNKMKTRYTMEGLEDGVVTLTFSVNGITIKKIYYPLQAQLLEAMAKNDDEARKDLSPDLRCRHDVLERLRVEIAAESVLCQQEAVDIARIRRSNPAEAEYRRVVLDVRNKTVGARGNELGRQRAALNKDIEAFKRKSRGAAPLAPRIPTAPAYSNPGSFAIPQRMNPTQYSPQVAYAPPPASAFAPPTGPKASQYSQPSYLHEPTIFHTRNSVQYQYPNMNSQTPPPNYGQQQAVPQPAPHPATFLLHPNSSRHQQYHEQIGYQHPPPSRPERRAPNKEIPRRHSDYYRPGYAEQDGDYYRPEYYSQGIPPAVPVFQSTPVDEGRLTYANENTMPRVEAGQYATRHEKLQAQPTHRVIPAPFPEPTMPPSRLNPKFLQPIQNMIRQESAKSSKRKAEKGEMGKDERRVKREKVESELPVPYPNEPLSYDELPLYTASPVRPKSGI